MSVARAALILAAAAGFVSAQLKVIAPGGSNLWWVANEANNIIWNCHESQVDNFTVLLANSNPTVLQGNFALIGIQENFDCSEGLAANQVNFTASDGYTILLANPLNQTQVYATSDVFEIKAQGATYPASSATPTDGSSTAASGSSTGSASGSSNTSGSSSSGALPNVQAGGLVGLVMAGAAALLAL